MSITEVAFAQAERSRGSLDAGLEAAIESFWADSDTIRLIEFDRTIAAAARDLVRRAIPLKRRLKPMDAIHLATAQRRQVGDFHTTDQPLQRDWQDLGFPVRDPYVLQPRLTE